MTDILNIIKSQNAQDARKDRFTLTIIHSEGVYEYKAPVHILDEIGPAELAKRIYSTFKINTSRRTGQAE